MCKLHIIYTCMHHTSNHSLICRLNTWWEFASSSSHKKNKLSTVNRSQRARAHTSSYLRVLLHIFIVCVDHNSQFCVCSVFWHLRSITQLHHSFLVNGMPHTHTLTIVRIDIFANYGVCDIRSKIRTKALWQQSALSLRVNKFFFVLDFFRPKCWWFLFILKHDRLISIVSVCILCAIRLYRGQKHFFAIFWCIARMRNVLTFISG